MTRPMKCTDGVNGSGPICLLVSRPAAGVLGPQPDQQALGQPGGDGGGGRGVPRRHGDPPGSRPGRPEERHRADEGAGETHAGGTAHTRGDNVVAATTETAEAPGS